ncbi:MAG: efflux RND transporter permease subunit [Magnetococcales bacterium]|nr:efflux RND transporter permease subunit [Magnetococcales bacterium]
MATPMIGLIGPAGIIVPNAMRLVDFIHGEVARRLAFEKAAILAGAVPTRPIVLTALAAMIGMFFIVDDPIFSGLAIALIFGLFVATILTLWIIPLLYFILARPVEKARGTTSG